MVERSSGAISLSGRGVQLLVEVQNDTDFCGSFFTDTPQHQEPAIGGHVVGRTETIIGKLVRALEQQERLPEREPGTGLDGYRHHLVAIAEKELAAVSRPHRLLSTIHGDLPLPAGVRVVADVNFVAA